MEAPRTLEALVDKYDGKIRAFLKTVTALGPADLDDMVQDVYLRVHKNDLLTRYTPDRAAFTSYLYLICRSVARNQHRSASRRPALQHAGRFLACDYLGRGAHVLATAPTQEEQVFLDELRETLANAPEIRDVIERVDRTGRLTKRDQARLLGVLQPVLA